MTTNTGHEILPSIAIASTPSSTNVPELLDRGKANWPEWSRSMTQALRLCALGGYLTGKIVCPDATAEPCAYNNWHLNNEICVAFIMIKCSPAEQDFVGDNDNAKDVWDMLKTRHEAGGPLTQVLLIQEALRLRYKRTTEPLSETSRKISQLVTRVFAIGTPDVALFRSILMLNALSDDFANVWYDVASSMAAATPSSPFGPDDFCKRLDDEQQIINAEGTSAGTVLHARSDKKQSASKANARPTCGNCNRGHSTETCWQTGGIMAGKREEVMAGWNRGKKVDNTGLSTFRHSGY